MVNSPPIRLRSTLSILPSIDDGPITTSAGSVWSQSPQPHLHRVLDSSTDDLANQGRVTREFFRVQPRNQRRRKVPTAERASEAKQPRRFEKKNTIRAICPRALSPSPGGVAALRPPARTPARPN